jgi:hypothetical protein
MSLPFSTLRNLGIKRPYSLLNTMNPEIQLQIRLFGGKENFPFWAYLAGCG